MSEPWFEELWKSDLDLLLRAFVRINLGHSFLGTLYRCLLETRLSL